MNFVKIVVLLFCIFCCIQLFKKYKEHSFKLKVCMNFCLINFIILLYLCFVIYAQIPGNERYLVRPLFLMYILTAYYIYHYILKRGFLTKIALVFGVILFTIPNNLTALPNIINYKQLREEQLGLVNFLKENDLNYGYASFWNSYNNTVLSNFDVQINAVNFLDKVEPFYWLNSKRYYDSNLYKDETFLLMNEEEKSSFEQSMTSTLLGEPIEKLQYENLYIYAYDYNIAMNNFNGPESIELELIQGMVTSNPEMKKVSGIDLSKGDIIYGPYMFLESGTYQLKIEPIDSNINYKITSGAGEKIWYEGKIDCNEIIFSIPNDVENFEVVLTTDMEEIITISSIVLNKIE